MAAQRDWNPAESTVERLPNELCCVHGQPGIMASAHWHAQVEVNFVLRGRIDYQMQGQDMSLRAGELALFWGGLPHRVCATADDTLYYAIHMPLTQFFRLRIDPELQRRLMHGAALVSAEPQPDDAAGFARFARYLLSGDARLFDHAVDALRLRLERLEIEPHRLLDPSGQGRADKAAAADAPGSQGLRRIFGFIAGHFREEIDSADIAAAAQVHPKYAMSLFKRSTGMSIGEYIALMRVSYAQALLVADRLNVLQVAMESGFGSVSAFNKCFRKTAGMTPSEFKRAHRRPPLAALRPAG